METKASYVTVGAFAILLLAGGLFLAIWFGGVSLDQETRPYRIDFEGAVDGLSTGSPVRYRGVPVGTVRDIRIEPENVELIRVDIDVDADVPIKRDMYAVLEAQGLTGIGFIQIEGGTAAAEPLEPTQDRPVPRIPARSSALSKVFETAPEIADQLIVLINRLQSFLSEENERRVYGILTDLATVSAAVAGRTDEIEAAIDGASVTVDELYRASAALGPLLDEASATLATVRGTAVGLDSEVTALAGSLGQASDNIAATAAQLEGMVAEARPGMKDFSNTGLYELTQFLVEARVLVSNIDRVLRQIDRDPSQFLFGDRDGQVETDQ